jgi:hypothetical protein
LHPRTAGTPSLLCATTLSRRDGVPAVRNHAGTVLRYFFLRRQLL